VTTSPGKDLFLSLLVTSPITHHSVLQMENSTDKNQPVSFRLNRKYLLILDYAAASWKCDRTQALRRIIDAFYVAQLAKGATPVSYKTPGGES